MEGLKEAVQARSHAMQLKEKGKGATGHAVLEKQLTWNRLRRIKKKVTESLL